MKKVGLSVEDVSALCSQKGRECAAGYLKLIALGHNRPSFSLCQFLASEIIGAPAARINSVALSIYQYPYSRTEAA